MTIALRHQVEASEQSMRELELEAFIEEKKVFLRDETEALLRSLQDSARRLGDCAELWKNRVAQNASQHGVDGAREIVELHRRLEKSFERMARFIGRAEQFGVQIEGQDAFRLSWSKLRGVACFDLDRITKAAQQAAADEGRELGEFVDELRPGSHA